MPVTRELNTTAKTARYIIHKGIGVFSIASADQPRNRQLGIGIQGNPGPNISDAHLTAHMLGDVLLLRINEAPNLIALDALARKVAHIDIVVSLTSPAHVR